MATYNHNEIENKWRKSWYDNNLYKAIDFSPKPKKYILAEFPYPSGKSLHVGHIMRYTLPDVYSRYLRMKGFNVLFPMAFDAFGLPSEIYAIKTGEDPAKYTKRLIEDYKESFSKMGYGIDVDREFSTTDPKYYKWTQWIFLKLYKAGLAEYKETPIWWCEQLKTVLADEEVLTDKDGDKISERGEFPVERKMFKQWVLKIPKYAEKLIQGLKTVHFPEAIKNAQINWIGKSEGLNITFPIVDSPKSLTVFTTRPDTIFGTTFIVISPEHELLNQITPNKFKDGVLEYVAKAKNKSELERISQDKDKTGVFTGAYAYNDKTNKNMPVYVADYVLSGVGTGAIMGVPGHDKRDFDFAKKYHLPVVRVVVGPNEDTSEITNVKQVFEGEGTMYNSHFLDGLDTKSALKKIMDYMEEKGTGKRNTTYRIRDWVFSRQRYWGEPIPMMHTKNGEIEPICDPDIPEEVSKYLPLELPEVPDYNPTSDGSSPLERNKEWVNTKDREGNAVRRETNTMPNWAGSSWYYIRYCDPHNDNIFADMEKMKYWLPVDKYFGGAEHTTLHLLYSRFWHKFLFDQGLVPTPEPYAWRLNGGLLLGPDGKKMSKSKGNVVEPLEVIERFGADALRMSICFLGPYEDTFPWNENSLKATSKLLNTIFSFKERISPTAPVSDSLNKSYNKLIKNISGMYEALKMNTAVSEIMIFVNTLKKEQQINQDMWLGFLKVLAPLAPFITEELWDGKESIHIQDWPSYDKSLVKDQTISIPVQVNGKLRAQIEIAEDSSEADVKKVALLDNKISKEILGKEIVKFIYVPTKIVSIVCK